MTRPYHGNQDFNPRTREGCDCILMAESTRTSYFNPRTREGCDAPLEACAAFASGLFQPTHP